MYAGMDSTKGGIISSGVRGYFGFGSAHNSNNPVTFLSLPVPMRATPAVTVGSAGHFSFDTGWGIWATYSAIAIQGLRGNTQSIALIGTTSGLTNGYAGSLTLNNSTGWLLLDSEL